MIRLISKTIDLSEIIWAVFRWFVFYFFYFSMFVIVCVSENLVFSVTETLWNRFQYPVFVNDNFDFNLLNSLEWKWN